MFDNIKFLAKQNVALRGHIELVPIEETLLELVH